MHDDAAAAVDELEDGKAVEQPNWKRNQQEIELRTANWELCVRCLGGTHCRSGSVSATATASECGMQHGQDVGGNKFKVKLNCE